MASYIQQQRAERAAFEKRRKESGRTREEQRAADNSNSAQAIQERRNATTQERAERLTEKGATQEAITATGTSDQFTTTAYRYVQDPNIDPKVAEQVIRDLEASQRRVNEQRARLNQTSTPAPQFTPAPNQSTNRGPSYAAPTIQRRIQAENERVKELEQRIQVVDALKSGAARRAEAAEAPFYKVPGLGGDNFAQRFGRDLLALPARAVLGTPEAINIAGATITTLGYATTVPEARGQIGGVLVQGAKDTPRAVGESLNPTKPEGLANLVGIGVLARAQVSAKIRATPDTTINAAPGTRVGTGVFKNAETTIIEVSGTNKAGGTVRGIITQTDGPVSTLTNTRGQVGQFVVTSRLGNTKRVAITETPRTILEYNPATSQRVGVDILTTKNVLDQNVRTYQLYNRPSRLTGGPNEPFQVLLSDRTRTIPEPSIKLTETRLGQPTERVTLIQNDPVLQRSVAVSERTQAFRLRGKADGLEIKGIRQVREDAVTQATYEITNAKLTRDTRIGETVVRTDRRLAPEARAPEFTFEKVTPKDRFLIQRDSDILTSTRFVAETKAPRSVTRGETSIGGGFEIRVPAPKPATTTTTTPTPLRPLSSLDDAIVERYPGIPAGSQGEFMLAMAEYQSGIRLDLRPQAPKPSGSSATITSGGAGIIQRAATSPRGQNAQFVLSPEAPKPSPLTTSLPPAPALAQIKTTPAFTSATTPQTIRTNLITTNLQAPAPVARITVLPPTTRPFTESPTSITPGYQTSTSSLRDTRSREITIPTVREELKPTVRPEINIASATDSRSRTNQRQPIQQQPQQSITPVLVQDPVLDTIQKTGQGRSPPPKPAFTSLPGPGTPKIPLLPVVLLPPIRLNNKTRTPGYRIQVRTAGSFRTLPGVFSQRDALEQGAGIVAGTPAASFRITPAKTAPNQKARFRGFLGQFNPSKRDKGVFVEQARLRLNTPGEKRGITLKGILSRKIRRVF